MEPVKKDIEEAEDYRYAPITLLCSTFPCFFAPTRKEAMKRGCRFFVLRILGTGASGTVFAVTDIAENKFYAVKLVDMESMTPADRERAETEVHNLVNCNSFFIVHCISAFYEREKTGPRKVKQAALILEYADAGDLRSEIQRRVQQGVQFTVRQIELLCIQMILAVYNVHCSGMLHRDIKSANILLTEEGLAKLADFGFGKKLTVAAGANSTQTFCGTPFYVAPEIWRRRPYSNKADMFSLGVLMYEVMMLSRPFIGKEMPDIMRRILSGRYEPIHQRVPKDLAALCQQMLAQDPEKRPSIEDALRTPVCQRLIDVLLKHVDETCAGRNPDYARIRDEIEATRLTVFREYWDKVQPAEQNVASHSSPTPSSVFYEF